MNQASKPLGALTLVVVLVMLAASCGDDDSSSDANDVFGASDSSSDSGGGDSGGDDSGGDDSGGDDSDGVGVFSLDCAELKDALESAGDLNTGSPIDGTSTGDLRESFEQNRASLAALGEAVPEISDAIDDALAGMDAMRDAFESIDWDTGNLASDPAKAVEFAGMISDPDVQGMMTGLTEVSAYIATECS